MQTTIETTQAKVSSIRRDFLFVFNVDKKNQIIFYLISGEPSLMTLYTLSGGLGKVENLCEMGRKLFPISEL